MFSVIWKYKINITNQVAFEAAYGPDGSWAAFFRTANSYRGSLLLNHTEEKTAYLLIDQWNSQKEYEAFLEEHGATYQKMSTGFEKLYLEEERIGIFQTRE